MKLSLIAACGHNRVIGIGNRLPWRLPEDLKYFRAKTSGHPVIMGRKTFESIGRPLPQRLNIVVSRQKNYAPSGVSVVASIEDAVHLARASGTPEAFVIGGAEIYAHTLPYADRLYLTLVETSPEGDAYFPEWQNLNLREVFREFHSKDENHDFDFAFLVLEKSN